MSELTLKVVVPSFDPETPLSAAVLNAILSGIQITLEGLAGSATIADGAVSTAKLADHAVTPVKLASGVAGGGLNYSDSTGLSVPSDGITPARVLWGNVALGASGSVTIDWATGLSFYSVLTNNITFAFTNVKEGQTVLIAVKQAAAGAKTVTWTPTILWPGGTTPVLTTTANKTDLFAIARVNGVYYGNYRQNY